VIDQPARKGPFKRVPSQTGDGGSRLVLESRSETR
jgi:hypothetical protein